MTNLHVSFLFYWLSESYIMMKFLVSGKLDFWFPGRIFILLQGQEDVLQKPVKILWVHLAWLLLWSPHLKSILLRNHYQYFTQSRAIAVDWSLKKKKKWFWAFWIWFVCIYHGIVSMASWWSRLAMSCNFGLLFIWKWVQFSQFDLWGATFAWLNLIISYTTLYLEIGANLLQLKWFTRLDCSCATTTHFTQVQSNSPYQTG